MTNQQAIALGYDDAKLMAKLRPIQAKRRTAEEALNYFSEGVNRRKQRAIIAECKSKAAPLLKKHKETWQKLKKAGFFDQDDLNQIAAPEFERMKKLAAELRKKGKWLSTEEENYLSYLEQSVADWESFDTPMMGWR